MPSLVVPDNAETCAHQLGRDFVPHPKVECVPVEQDDRFAGALGDDVERDAVAFDDHGRSKEQRGKGKR